MAARLTCSALPEPLDDFAVRFDPVLHTPAQRRGFRAYVSGLLLPRDRNKTLTALALVRGGGARAAQARLEAGHAQLPRRAQRSLVGRRVEVPLLWTQARRARDPSDHGPG